LGAESWGALTEKRGGDGCGTRKSWETDGGRTTDSRRGNRDRDRGGEHGDASPFLSAGGLPFPAPCPWYTCVAFCPLFRPFAPVLAACVLCFSFLVAFLVLIVSHICEIT
jgi:hypothetical protein